MMISCHISGFLLQKSTQFIPAAFTISSLYMQVIQEAASSGDAEGPFYQAVFSRAHDIFHMRRRMMNLQVGMEQIHS